MSDPADDKQPFQALMLINGQVVGRIESWTPSPGRDIKPTFELPRDVRVVTVFEPTHTFYTYSEPTKADDE